MKLDKIKMPNKKKSMMDEYTVMELESEPGESDDNAGDSAGEFKGESEGEVGEEPEMESEPEMGNEQLAGVSDEDLLAELKKRGLSSKLRG